MRIRRDELVFKALVALDEAAEAALAGPIEPDHAVRFALAYLYASSEGDCLWVYRDYWKVLRTNTGSADNSEYLQSYCRSRDLDTSMRGISRSVGVKWSIDYQNAVRRARAKTATGPDTD